MAGIVQPIDPGTRQPTRRTFADHPSMSQVSVGGSHGQDSLTHLPQLLLAINNDLDFLRQEGRPSCVDFAS
ncbi:hypothetical protein D3C72_2335400 [compost metagenome]